MVYSLLQGKIASFVIVSLLLVSFNSTSANMQDADVLSNSKSIQQTEDDDWADDWAEEEESSPWQVTGFVEAAYGQFLQSNVVENSAALNEFRARVNIDYSHRFFEFNGKVDNTYDAVLNKAIWHTRELNFAVSPLNFVDVKIGRQVLTWGTGDYLFLNDLFAKDWQSFFSGRADEYLKAPSDSVRTNWYFEDVNFTLVWTPDFTPDRYITGERFSFYSPQMQQIIAPSQTFPVIKTNKSQWAARLNTRVNDIELSLYGYQGFWPTPVGSKAITAASAVNTQATSHQSQQSQGYFPKLNSWGFSALTAYLGGIVNIEYSSYNSIENSQGSKNAIANGQHRLLIGYEREVIKNLTASVQYYLERTKHYQALVANSNYPAQLVDENRQLLTLRLTYSTKQQTLTYSLFSFYSPTDKDAYLKPSIDYRYNDQWQFSVGANIFFGKDDYSFFGQHQDNSNAWLRLRYQY